MTRPDPQNGARFERAVAGLLRLPSDTAKRIRTTRAVKPK